ncbi:MAG TPA: tetratricopeptide repeat protein [Terriglobales bacterium]|jgi:tetratricopeptide (TPR) repeat protein|nr:tetratricopeptide repeat protein [Terriglobales bacterium]
MATPPKRRWTTRPLAAIRKKLFRPSLYVFWLTLLAVGFFVLTFYVNRRFAVRQRQLSSYWFQQAQALLEQGRAKDAILDLRTALFYSHENPQYSFALAQALATANQTLAARSYFLNLLQDEPGNGSVNLELARLAVKENDASGARRYFNSAIYGTWDRDPILRRQQVRQELINFLIARGLKTQARGELLTFTADMPNTPNLQLWVARAFTRLDDDRSALDFYTAALPSDRRDVAALLGAGWSAFRLGRYREALEYFKGADAIHQDPATSQMIGLVSLVIDLNPFESRLSAAERRHRVILAMDIIDHRLQQCSEAQQVALEKTTGNPLQMARSQWIYLDRQVRLAYKNADLVQLLAPIATLVTNIEQQNGCGSATPNDQAMLRIYQNGEELRP